MVVKEPITYALSVYLKSTLPLKPTSTDGRPSSILMLVVESDSIEITDSFLFISPNDVGTCIPGGKPGIPGWRPGKLGCSEI